jgi:hypothetical protein
MRRIQTDYKFPLHIYTYVSWAQWQESEISLPNSSFVGKGSVTEPNLIYEPFKI